MKAQVDDAVFERRNGTDEPLEKGAYTGCRFVQCNFSRADFTGITFMECVFEGCDLSLAKVRGTAFRDVRFLDCKLLGLAFDQANPFLFSIRPERSMMDSTAFNGMDLRKMRFANCRLQGAHFSRTVLAEAVFEGCDLTDAVFDGTDLQRADLRTAHGFTIRPEANRLKGARFTSGNVHGLLAHYGVSVEP